jgi:hypothetical protein
LTGTGSAPFFGCRAWVNFDGTGSIGSNQTIRASGNVSRVYKDSTGIYTIYFTTSMADTNYAITAWARSTNNSSTDQSGGIITATLSGSKSSSSFQIQTIVGHTRDAYNPSEVGIAIFR